MSEHKEMTAEEKIKANEEVIRTLQSINDDLRSKIESKQKKYSWWVPTEEQETKTLSIDNDGDIIESCNVSSDDHFDAMKSIANVYSEEDEKLAYHDALAFAARQRIQRTADKLHGERYEFNWKSNNWEICLRESDVLKVENSVSYQNINAVYLASPKLARQCLDLCLADFEFLAGVDQDEV